MGDASVETPSAPKAGGAKDGAPRGSLRLAYVVDGRLPTEKANGYQSAQMCQAFLEAGARVELLLPVRRFKAGEGIAPETTIAEYYHLRTPLVARKVFSLDLVPLLEEELGLSPGNPAVLAASLLRSGVSAVSLAVRLRASHPDAVFVRSHLLLLSLLPLLPAALRRRVFFEAHTLPAGGTLRSRLLRALGRCGGVITVTGQLKLALEREGLPPEAILAAHDGVDLATFDFEADREEARRRLGLPQEARIASFVGKFHTKGEEKGIPEILRAAKSLVEEFPDLRFLFVGGPLDRAPAYREIIQSEGLPPDRFAFIDKRPVEEVPWYLKASDVLLMPHPWSEFYAYHVSPLKLFEYMSSGRPIVASDLPSIGEVLANGRNALLGKPGDPESIATNVAQLLRDPSLGARLAERAHVDVQGYSWAGRAGSLLAFMAARLS